MFHRVQTLDIFVIYMKNKIKENFLCMTARITINNKVYGVVTLTKTKPLFICVKREFHSRLDYLCLGLLWRAWHLFPRVTRPPEVKSQNQGVERTQKSKGNLSFALIIL